MALTRRTDRFAELARETERRLADHGVDVGAEVIDEILRKRVDAVAGLMRIAPRSALAYAPDDLPRILAASILEAVPHLPAQRSACPGAPSTAATNN